MKLLLIMPNFFDYPQIITKELNKMGYEVDFYDDRPSTNAWIKAILRINPNFLKSYVKRYFNKIMASIRNEKYDIVFLISGQSLSFSENMVEQIKKSQPKAKFILYQWDSERNFPYIGKVQKFFDECYSFDRIDCESNNRLKFLPLFYSDKYKNIGEKKRKEYLYDFCFVGTAHPRKYSFVKKITKQLMEVYPKQFIYFFFPSVLVYFYRKLKNPELRKSHINEFHYKALTGRAMEEIYEESYCILDSPQDGQLGLTMRTIEAIGAKKKLITTNEDVKNYDFYFPQNIYVYSGEVDFSDVFFSSEYFEIPMEIYNNYSLHSWLSKLMSN